MTKSTVLGAVRYFILFPLSFSSFSAADLTSISSSTYLSSQHHSTPTILVPRPPAVYASILRMMLSYPRYCPTRTVLESDLSELIGYNLYDLQDGFIDLRDDELWEELEVDRRIDDAVQIVKGWGCSGEWREGEEWMGDALAAVVEGSGNIDFLPWAK
jgi:hypothetical protein